MRIVELPLPLCSPGKLALSLLIARPTALARSHTIYMGDNFDFDGSTPPESYQVLATHNRFAKAAVVAADYSAETHTLDFSGSLVMRLTGADLTLEEVNSTNGLSNDLLIFVGDEILSVLGFSLIGAGTYRLNVARGCYGTTPADHATDAEAFFIYRADLLALEHTSFQPGNAVTFKASVDFGTYAQDLSLVDAIEHTVAGTALAVAPCNLQVNGAQRNAQFIAATDLYISWSLPDQRDLIKLSFPLNVRTLLEIVNPADLDDVWWSKLTTDAQMKIGGARVDTIRGAETSFVVRVRTDVLGTDYHIASAPVTLTVTQL